MKKATLLIPLITLLVSCNNGGSTKWKVISADEAVKVANNIATNWHMPSRAMVKFKDDIVYVGQDEEGVKKYKSPGPRLTYDVNKRYAKMMQFRGDPLEEYYITRPSENDESTYTLWYLKASSEYPESEGAEITFKAGNKSKTLDASKEAIVSIFRVNLYALLLELELYPITAIEQIITECEYAQGTSEFESKDNKSLKAHFTYTVENVNTFEYYGLYENYFPKEILSKTVDTKSGKTTFCVHYVFDHESKIVEDKINLEEWEETHD